MNDTVPTYSDRIERSILLKAPRERVWRALADAQEFGTWFRLNLAGQTFAPGREVRGHVTYPGYEHLKVDMLIERMEPPALFSYRWHPYPADPKVDYSVEERTLVTFTLEEQSGGGTLLKVVESGFDKVPAHRRLEAFRMNSGGWEGQMRNIAAHVDA